MAAFLSPLLTRFTSPPHRSKMRGPIASLLLLLVVAHAAHAVLPQRGTPSTVITEQLLLRTRGGRWGKAPPPPPPPEVVEAPPAPAPFVSPAAGPYAQLRAFAILSAAGGSWALFRNPDVRAWFEDVRALHPRYFPLSRHQVLIFLAWFVNKLAVRIPGRSDGKSWKDTTVAPVRFFTPSAYAFAIWAPIFLGELLLTFYQLGSGRFAPALQPYLAKLAPPLAQAFAAQSLWCVAFRPWVGAMQFIPSALLAMTAVGLSRVHSVLREAVAAGAMRPWDYLIVHLPLSLHFGWITCATLVNLNGWFAVTDLRVGDKLGLALASINLAVTLGGQVTLASGDPVIALVVAWALYAVADDLIEGKSLLRKNNLVGADALDCLEVSARVSAGLQAGLAGAVILWKVLRKAGVVKQGDAAKLMQLSMGPLKTLLG